MKDTVWISNIEYEHYIAREIKKQADKNMRNPHFMKDHTKHSVSSIHDEKD